MKYASDFRRIAREALRGRWGIAVVAGVIASMLGVVTGSGPEINLEFNGNGSDFSIQFAGQQIFNSESGFSEALIGLLIGGAVYLLIVCLVMAVIYFIISSIIGVGYAKFNLDLVDRQKEADIGTMFGFFKHWKTTAVAGLLRTVYVFLWSLLLVIPGIIASYSYMMTDYILAEHPELTASEALARSKEMMTGNRWRLFCLQFSFIGWSLLCSLTMGIGNLWLTPYQQSARAAFYREISGTIPAEPVAEEGPEFL